MRGFWSRPYVFGLIYGLVLILFAAFVLLDTFVIPKGYGAMEGEILPPVTDVAGTDSASAGTEDSVDSGADAPVDPGLFPEEPEMGEDYYRDRNISIFLVKTRQWNTDIYVAEVQIRSPEHLRTALAEDTYGRNIKEKTSEMAKRVGAILAINGDYYGFRDSGYVIRNGTLYRDKKLSSSREALVIDGDGKMYGVREGAVTARALWKKGAQQVLSFGPVLYRDSAVQVTDADEIGKWESNPRAAIGMIEPLHYVFVVSDGRTDRSAGLSLVQLAQFMGDWGCSFAYNLDGGGSATMVFRGKVINKPTDGSSFGERKVSDIVYIG